MNIETLEKCQHRVYDRLGSAASSKASDRFCLEFGAPRKARKRVHAVVELAVDPRPGLADLAARLHESPAAREALQAAQAAVRELGDEGLAGRMAALLNPTDLLREAFIREMRERCHRAAGGIRWRLDRGVAGSAPGKSARLKGYAGPPLTTRLCWLNQTLRVQSDPDTLAEVAEDESVRYIDVPRPLRPEIGRTGTVVGAMQHRDANGHTGKGVVVAVIDFEVDRSHPAFQDRVVHKKNYTNEPWGHPGPHGTAVAGIIAARGDMLGMAPDAVIYNYKVFMTDAANLAEDFYGALALQRALEDGAKVANCSWGTDAPTDGTSREARACDNAWAAGMTVVTSVGNEGRDPGTMTSPADADGVIAVGATDREGRSVQRYSSRGPTANGKNPHLVAPGGRQGGRGIDSCKGDGFGDCRFGTSLAAPHVSGLLAVLLEMHPGLRPDEQRRRLLELCTPLHPQFGGGPEAQGRGLISIASLATGLQS